VNGATETATPAMQARVARRVHQNADSGKIVSECWLHLRRCCWDPPCQDCPLSPSITNGAVHTDAGAAVLSEATDPVSEGEEEQRRHRPAVAGAGGTILWASHLLPGLPGYAREAFGERSSERFGVPPDCSLLATGSSCPCKVGVARERVPAIRTQ
jgi:hypothetical protein